jgi:hypothetical protein
VRLGATRYATKAQPIRVKKDAAKVKHLQAPIKGLSVNSAMVQGDALTASILDNWIVEKDRVTVRPGLTKQLTLAAGTPIETIIPFYGDADTFLLASGGQLYTSSGVPLVSTLGSNEWNWTAFSNLGEADYTVMVNGVNGVFSWDGGSRPDPASPHAVTSLSNSNPAVVTVTAGQIGSYSNGMMVTIAGADATHAAANGTHQISSVGSPANTFTLNGVNTSAASGPQTTGVTVDPLGSVFPETITAPVGESWVDVNKFHTVLSHMNRLWFADKSNLAVYYLPIQSKSGQLKMLPLNAVFRRGGWIKAMASWTLDGGAGTEDQLVLLSSNGEAVIYNGTDPDSDFALTGIFKFDAPMSMKSLINYGGDLYVMVSTGLVPMSTLLRAESEQLGTTDKNVSDMFSELTHGKHSLPGWQVILNYHAGWAICNFPTGGKNVYRQMVRFMPDPVWCSWSNVPARCWQWIARRLLLGSDDGILYEMRLDALSDDGRPIVADMQLTFSAYDSSAIKQWKMISPYIITDGVAKPYVDIRVDYDYSPPFNQPDVSLGATGATWDVATWDVDYWAQQPTSTRLQNGVSAIGRVGAPRVKVSVVNCEFSIAGFDILYETGGAFG